MTYVYDEYDHIIKVKIICILKAGYLFYFANIFQSCQIKLKNFVLKCALNSIDKISYASI